MKLRTQAKRIVDLLLSRPFEMDIIKDDEQMIEIVEKYIRDKITNKRRRNNGTIRYSKLET
jgi:hypothetical protein